MSAPRGCNVLMIYPRFLAESFWNFAAACEIMGARYPAAPLGLITVAALLPPHWNVRLVNRNTEELTEGDLAWADMVMTGGMLVQQPDTLQIIEMCHARGKPVVVGGPDATSSPHVYRVGGFPGSRRSRGRHRPVHRRLGGGRQEGRVRGREIPGRRDQEPDPALRPAEVRPISLYRRAVLARLPVHVRVLRHHRAVRPQAARQDQRRRCWPSFRPCTMRATAATSISSTTT